tara:strand:- start:2406 stop:3455 length:1050 start_codon:yes stop_codon:yes gene_type:complete
MQITQTRLKQLIYEEIETSILSSIIKEEVDKILREKSSSLKSPTNDKTRPISDDIMSAVLRVTDKKKVNEAPDDEEKQRKLIDDFLDDDQKKMIRNAVDKLGGGADAVVKVAKYLGVPLAIISGLVGGVGAGLYMSTPDTDTSTPTEFDQTELVDDTLVPSDMYGTAWADLEGEFAGLSNAEKMEKSWSQYDNIDTPRAPVTSQFHIFKYSHVPPESITDNSILPLSGMHADDYYNYWNQKVESNPSVELPLLKKLVFGDVGKWSGGSGKDANFKKADDGSNLLPPDWTVAYTVYSDIVEQKMFDLYDALQTASPEEKEQIYDQLPNVNNDADFDKFMYDTLYSVGRSQ